MEKIDMKVSVPPKKALELVQQAVTGSFSGELLDEYSRTTSDGKSIVMGLFEKYYMRSGNRATLTLLAQDISGETEVHLSAGGGGQGMVFRFDWGAGESFAELAKKALREYEVR